MILAETNTSLDKALKVNVYLRDITDFQSFNEVYAEYFDADAPPARTTVEVGPFAEEEIVVEIGIIAYIHN